MRSIPRDAVVYADDRGLLFEYLPDFVGRRRPVPTPLAGVDRRFLVESPVHHNFVAGPLLRVQKRNEVHSQPVLMRTLPRSRFCGSLGEEVQLPSGAAETLEDFEAALKLAGFIKPGQALVQSNYFPGKFRVQEVETSVNGVGVHGGSLREGDAPHLGGQSSPSRRVPSPSVAPAAGQGRRAERPLTREAAKAIDVHCRRAKPRR